MDSTNQPGRANQFVFSEMACPAPFAKIFLFSPEANQFTDSHRLVPLEGRSRVVTSACVCFHHTRGCGCIDTRHSPRPQLFRANASCITRAPRVAGTRRRISRTRPIQPRPACGERSET